MRVVKTRIGTAQYFGQMRGRRSRSVRLVQSSLETGLPQLVQNNGQYRRCREGKGTMRDASKGQLILDCLTNYEKIKGGRRGGRGGGGGGGMGDERGRYRTHRPNFYSHISIQDR